MNNENTQQDSKFILTIIWGALLFSMLLYLYIGETAATPKISKTTDITFFNILAGIGIVCAFVSQFFFQKAIRIINDAIVRGEDREIGIKKAFPILIISWAIGESIAVFGLVLAYNGTDMSRVYSFFAAAILLHLFRHPFRL